VKIQRLIHLRRRRKKRKKRRLLTQKNLADKPKRSKSKSVNLKKLKTNRGSFKKRKRACAS
jgi:hypothetical protein